MCHMHLDSIESAFLQTNGSLDLLALCIMNLIDGKSTGGMTPRSWNGNLIRAQRRGAYGQFALRTQPARRTNMMKLAYSKAIMLMNCGRKPCIPGTNLSS